MLASSWGASAVAHAGLAGLAVRARVGRVGCTSRRAAVRCSAQELVDGGMYTLANAEGLQAALQPTADAFSAMGLPDALVKWGHPGNMAVVLAAMGGFGTYKGFQIKLSDDADVVAEASDMHPKLMGGMTFFFALGAIGGLLSLTMQGKPLFESAHAITGIIGLLLLALQTATSFIIDDDADMRSIHSGMGAFTMLWLCVHLSTGLGLSGTL